MYTCDHCKKPIDQFNEHWGTANNQNDEGDTFTVIPVNDNDPQFTIRISHDDDISRHYHATCVYRLLTMAMASEMRES